MRRRRRSLLDLSQLTILACTAQKPRCLFGKCSTFSAKLPAASFAAPRAPWGPWAELHSFSDLPRYMLKSVADSNVAAVLENGYPAHICNRCGQLAMGYQEFSGLGRCGRQCDRGGPTPPARNHDSARAPKTKAVSPPAASTSLAPVDGRSKFLSASYRRIHLLDEWPSGRWKKSLQRVCRSPWQCA
jgi:hypothetical protein